MLKGKPSEPPPSPGQQRARRIPTPQEPQTEDEAERERMRRFFEALGVPPEEMPPTIQRDPSPPPPPTVPTQPKAPTVVSAPSAREPVRQKDESTPHSVAEAGASIREAARAAKSSAQAYVTQHRPSSSQPTLTKAELEALEKIKAAKRAFPTAPAKSRRRGQTAGQSTRQFATLLASPQGLRDAFVIREILGPPKAIQEQVGIAALSR